MMVLTRRVSLVIFFPPKLESINAREGRSLYYLDEEVTARGMHIVHTEGYTVPR